VVNNTFSWRRLDGTSFFSTGGLEATRQPRLVGLGVGSPVLLVAEQFGVSDLFADGSNCRDKCLFGSFVSFRSCESGFSTGFRCGRCGLGYLVVVGARVRVWSSAPCGGSVFLSGWAVPVPVVAACLCLSRTVCSWFFSLDRPLSSPLLRAVAPCGGLSLALRVRLRGGCYRVRFVCVLVPLSLVPIRSVLFSMLFVCAHTSLWSSFVRLVS